MVREFSRTLRVAESIKRTLAPLVNDWMRENHSGMASVTHTDISPDLKRSCVHVSFYGCDDTATVIAELNHQTGYFRHALSGKLRLRNVPVIEFYLDESIKQGDKVSRMLEMFKADGSER